MRRLRKKGLGIPENDLLNRGGQVAALPHFQRGFGHRQGITHAFGVPGITVDTHVGRLVRRWGWRTSEDPVVVEREIAALVERPEWTLL